MIAKQGIQMFKLLPATISELADKLNIYPGSATKIAEKLIINGLAKKQREGKKVLIIKEQTTHAQELEEIIQSFARLPFEELLTYSNLTLISLLDYPLNSEELRQIINVTRQWIYKKIRQLSYYGILLKEKQGYMINPIHLKIHSFAKNYYNYKNYQQLRKITEDAQIIWQHGNEFLFKTKKDLKIHSTTAVTVFSKYNLPLLGEIKYYYNTKRKLQISDVILHTILINPQSKTYNAYACLLYEKTKPTDIVKKARIYNLTEHVQTIISYIKEQASDKSCLPTWEEYESMAKQYGVK